MLEAIDGRRARPPARVGTGQPRLTSGRRSRAPGTTTPLRRAAGSAASWLGPRTAGSSVRGRIIDPEPHGTGSRRRDGHWRGARADLFDGVSGERLTLKVPDGNQGAVAGRWPGSAAAMAAGWPSPWRPGLPPCVCGRVLRVPVRACVCVCVACPAGPWWRGSAWPARLVAMVGDVAALVCCSPVALRGAAAGGRGAAAPGEVHRRDRRGPGQGGRLDHDQGEEREHPLADQARGLCGDVWKVRNVSVKANGSFTAELQAGHGQRPAVEDQRQVRGGRREGARDDRLRGLRGGRRVLRARDLAAGVAAGRKPAGVGPDPSLRCACPT